jgi:parallel beta-helix repeat protein
MSAEIIKHFRLFSQSFSRLIPALAILFCVAGVAQAKTWTTSAQGLQNTINKARDGDTIQVTGGSTRSQILVKKPLTIEGKGNHTLSGMMTVKAPGAVIRNLTFRNVGNGGRSASIRVINANKVRVENNDIAGSQGMGIFVGGSQDVKVTGNNIRDVRCMQGSSGYTTSQGIKVGQNSKRVIVKNNTVEGMQGCRLVAAFYCDTGGTDGVFERNRVRKVGNASGDAVGVYIESRCHNWDVMDNIVYDVQTGVRNGSPGTSDPNNTLIDGNFIIAKEVGVKLIRGNNVIVTNNDIKAPKEILDARHRRKN